MDTVQIEIADKLEHGFDTRHIYQMFSTFVDTIKSQSEQILEMQENAERTDLLIENMTQSVRNMEMNIQGFVSLPAIEDDGTLRASRGPSISGSRRPSVQHYVLEQQQDLIENAVQSIPKPTSTSTSPRLRPNEWEDSPEQTPPPTDEVSGTSTSTTEPIPAPRKGSTPTITQEKPRPRRDSGRIKAPSSKFKKRRIIRQVSMKLKEVDESALDSDDTSATQEENLNKETVPIEEHLPVPVPDKEEIDVPKKDNVVPDNKNEPHEDPVIEHDAASTNEVKQEPTQEREQATELESEDSRESPRLRSNSEKEADISQGKEQEREETKTERAETEREETKIEREETKNEREETKSGREETKSEREETKSEREETKTEREETKNGREETKTEREETKKERDPTSHKQEVPSILSNASRVGSKRPSLSVPLSHRSDCPDDMHHIDPTQTVAYRIAALEAQVMEMADIIGAQRNALDVQRNALDEQQYELKAQQKELEAQRRTLEAAPPRDDSPTDQQSDEPMTSSNNFFSKDEFTEDVTIKSNRIMDVEDEEEDSDINVRDEDKDRSGQQDDVKTKTRVAPKHVSNAAKKGTSHQNQKQQEIRRPSRVPAETNRPYDDVNVVKFNDERELPSDSASIISRQVCSSEPMNRLLERVVKDTEKMMDQSIKRLPKPPVQISANDMLTDSIVAALASSMLKRGLLDDLKGYPSEPPSPTTSARVSRPSAPQIMMQLPTPTGHSTSETSRNNAAELKNISDSIVSKQDILDMIKDQIKRIPPPPTPLQPPPRIEFTPFVNAATTPVSAPTPTPTEHEILPKKYQPMDDDSAVTVDTTKDQSLRGLSSRRVTVREATMGERAKTVLEQHVATIETDKASNAQLDALSHNLGAHVSMEVSKIATHYEGLFEQFSSSLQGRQDNNEKSIIELRHSLSDFELSVSNLMHHSNTKSSKKTNNDEASWKSDLLKVSQSINKAREDQKSVAKMLVEELENLQNQMKDRVDENRLEHLAQSIEEKVQKEMGESVSGINLSMAKIISAVRNKTDRGETEVLIQTRLQEAEESLRDLLEEEPAGAFKCISCGTAGKKMTPNTSLESLSFASAIMSQSAEVKRNRGGDFDQTAAVLNRQAGLRPVSRQQKPMTPKVYTPSSAPTKEMTTLEPLYRRAKHANQVREIPKIPNITFGVGNQNQYRLDDKPSSVGVLPTLGGGSYSAPTKNGSLSGAL